jgi:hypothetical protein
VLALYTGNAVGSLTPVACNNNATGTLQSRLLFTATAGTTYRIQVGGASGSFGNLSVRFAAAPAPPPNDNFAAAAPVTTLPAQFTATTDSATTEPGEPTTPSCGGAVLSVGNTVWYQYMPASNAVLTVDTFGSSFDTVLVVYTGSAVNGLTQLACDDNSLQTLQSRVTLTVAAGTTYRIQAGGQNGAFGSLVVHVAAAPPPPPNDNFAAAAIVPTLPSQFAAVTNSATLEPGEGNVVQCAGTALPIGNTVWYSFTPGATTPVTVDTFGSNFDTLLAVYTTSALPLPFTPDVACNDDAGGTAQSQVSFVATAGTTYRVQVGGFNSAFGNLTVQFAVTRPPANDNFAAAASLPALPTTQMAVTLNATTEPGEPLVVDPSCGAAGGALGRTVWYTLTPGAATTVTVDTFGSGFDTVVAVYTGAALGSLTRIACNDDVGGTVQSQISFTATAGTTYRLQVGGFNGAAGDLVVNVSSTPGPPPRAARASKLPPRPPTPGALSPKLSGPGTAPPAPGRR